MSLSTTIERTEIRPTGAAGARRRKVLVVSYNFPPAGDVGVHRTLRFIKWLPAMGWEPIVLTVGNGKVHRLDPSLLEKVSGDVEIHRTPSFEMLNYGTSMSGRKPLPLPGVVSKMFRELPCDLWKLASVPDDKIGWIPTALYKGLQIIHSRDVEAIYVSGKPFSSYAIGEALGWRFQIPWIMDLRDLWTLNRREQPRKGLRTFIERRLERHFVLRAAKVVVNTPDNRSDFIAAFPECDPEKFVAITNGYDADDFAGLRSDKYEKFTIAYAGSFYFPRNKQPNLYRRLVGLHRRKSALMESYSPKCLFEALASLFAKDAALRDRVQVVMSGRGCEKTQAMVEQFGLEKHVKLLGWLSYQESLQMLKRAHVQLLVLSTGDESKGWIPSKLFQYLGSGNRILAQVPEGDVKDIVTATEAGVALEPGDVAGTERAIREMVRRYCEPSLEGAPRWDLRAAYEAKQLTERLAACLDAAVVKGAAR